MQVLVLIKACLVMHMGIARREWLESMHTQAVLALTGQETHVTVNWKLYNTG